ncbi:DUF2332 domain-containing protein [uncultured Jatrophihabitans sp.]|uniref:DUF2332 domain-containing protein n=1 Tax=uncultured Jatrophihabitans sp. TaxID=1610747 RepID=UPI0035CB51BC
MPDPVPDWTGLGRDTAERYREMARDGYGAISPSYARLAAAAADDAQLLAGLETLPAMKRQPNLLMGAVRYLGGPVDTWRSFRDFLGDRWGDVADVMRVRRTQTNEAARCTALLPVLAGLPQPLALLEVGASAGLCLYPDRYAYRYTSSGAAHEVGDGSVTLPCATTGPAPLPSTVPHVRWRGGLDLNPLDVSDDDDVRWLESLIWPEEVERFARLHAAVAIARADPPRIAQGDLVHDLLGVVEQVPPDVMLVVFHTAVLAYVDPAGRAAFREAVAGLAGQRPTCWVANEAPGIVGSVPPPAHGAGRFVLAVDERPIAFAGQHGASLDWFDDAQVQRPLQVCT